MSDYKRFLLTFDSARGAPVKVEQIGEAGELAEVELPDFLRLLKPTSTPAAAPQQVVINIYGGGIPGTPTVEQGAPQPPLLTDVDRVWATKFHRDKPKKEE